MHGFCFRLTVAGSGRLFKKTGWEGVMSVRVGINGFGRNRAGSSCVRPLRQGADVEFVGINDLTDAKTLVTLFKYDSVHGVFPGTVEVEDAALVIDGKRVRVTSETGPRAAPLAGHGRRRRHRVDGAVHRAKPPPPSTSRRAAHKVIISAPARTPT